MKVLARDKIVETFRFPFSEALSFSILLWTIWGFLESFFWQRAMPFFDSGFVRVHHMIYMAAFLIYLVVATITAALVFGIARWVMFTMDLHETPRFRSITLCVILTVFFLAAISFVFRDHMVASALPRLWQYLLLAFTILISAVILAVMYRFAIGAEFRIRRSGTTMASVLVLSVLLSFVSFPIFSKDKQSEPPTQDLKSSTYRLMAVHYILDVPKPSSP